LNICNEIKKIIKLVLKDADAKII